MFLSTFEKQLDAKRRIVVPQDYRALTSGPFDGIFCFPSIEADCIEAGGKALFDRYVGVIEELEFGDPIRSALETSVLGGMARLAFDTAGRITLPETLCEMFGPLRLGGGRGPRRPVPDLGARSVPGAPLGAARRRPRGAWPTCAPSSAWRNWGAAG